MSEGEKLIQGARRECFDGYFVAPHLKIKPFAGTPDESDLLFYVSLPSYNLSKYNVFLPEIFKRLRKGINRFPSRMVKRGEEYIWEHDLRRLFVFHYPLNPRAFRHRKNLYLHAALEEHDIDLRKLERRVRQTMPASCIFPRFSGIGRRVDISLPTLIGRRALMEDIMSFLKSQKGNI